jgi:hypothetical protein
MIAKGYNKELLLSDLLEYYNRVQGKFCANLENSRRFPAIVCGKMLPMSTSGICDQPINFASFPLELVRECDD